MNYPAYLADGQTFSKLDNISAAIVVDQQRLGGNSRSTVATVTDTAQMLRVLFSRIATPRLPSYGFYSSNDPRGMCTECEGIGQVASMDMSAVIDESKFSTSVQPSADSAAVISLAEYKPNYLEYESNSAAAGIVVFSEI